MRKNPAFIFLDIDGVLNTSTDWKRMYRLDDACVARFLAYAQSIKGEIRVILTSSWKAGYDPGGNHTPQIRHLIDRLADGNVRVLGKTETREDGDRAKEINEYIAAHHLEKISCVIIDDDSTLFKTKLMENCQLLLMDARKGFLAPETASKASCRSPIDLFKKGWLT